MLEKFKKSLTQVNDKIYNCMYVCMYVQGSRQKSNVMERRCGYLTAPHLRKGAMA